MTSIRAALIAAAVAGLAGAASAQDAAAVVEDAAGEAPAALPAAPVAPWYQRFTQETERFDLGGTPVDRSGPTLEFDVTGDIGLSLGFERGSGVDARREPLDGLNAGAFFKVSPRMRVGGSLGYRAESGNPASLRPEDQPGASQVKLESAFRF